MHQVLCTLSHDASDVRCTICGQGFLIYWSRFSRAEQAECRRVIQDQLRNHHIAAKDTIADRRRHPRHPFNVPEWTGMPEFSAAALLGNSKSVAADSLSSLDDHAIGDVA